MEALLAVSLKATVYGGSLLAAGSTLFVLLHPAVPTHVRCATCCLATTAAIISAVTSLALLLARASFLGGGGWTAATDPALLSIVAESPLGTSVAFRLAGLLLLAGWLSGLIAWRWFGVAGAVVAVLSFGLEGHTTTSPRLLLHFSLTIHLLGIAYWIGALFPIAKTAACEDPVATGVLADAFGGRAVWGVSALLVAGAVLALILAGPPVAAVASDYGVLLASKLGFVLTLIALAARNRLRLTPRLQRGDPLAPQQLRRSIALEALAVGCILLTTASLTSFATPPAR